ncbi:ABC transporter substrate-binding protein [Couchioplanes caeruleus]|uniref:ABC transporter substrate-binding protein n=2 Tax=Couchioplanes caeruleus TaxID=56438 RepID=A0A1K0GEM0_9ACTN|nr:ABC transporter substrate-binding protein [Couchioplanes caeruleus]OJF10590.1 ABC transporter substrate-binding protein [Couchioplanes caeruleus subsp. caeruleus]ROP30215.1 amino acid/amide ABC transporter substrate-binding protein (HAAT family) [Couchioplanes caeruleus]
MRLPRRLTASAAASALVISALTGCDSGSEPGAKADVVIGADLASGSAMDAAYARALQLRVEQINASGVLSDHNLVLRVQDNKSDPTASLRNISTLADDPSVAAIISGGCNECVVGAAKTINDKRVPTIALAAADEVSTPVESRRYVFKIGPNASDSSAALVADLVRTHTRSVALLYSDDLYGKGGRTRMTAQLARAGISVKNQLPVKPTATDVTQTVGTLTDAEPDALVVWTGPDQATLAAMSAKAAGYQGRMYFDAAAAGDLFLPQEAAAATSNATMVFTQILAIDDVIATTPAKAARKQWFRDYTSRYGSYSGVASFGADAVSLIADAVARAGGDRQQIRAILETSQTDGLSGPIRLTPDNHSGLMPQALTLLVARSGRWRLLS